MKRYTICALIGAFFSFATLTTLACISLLRPAEYDDPFLAFEQLAPGQPTVAIDKDLCDYQNYYEFGETGFYCHMELSEGPFTSLMISGKDETIRVLWFGINNLQVGDLVYRWGRPDTIQRLRYHYVSLRWHEGVYAIVNTRGWYTLGSLVQFVAIRQPAENNRQSS